jgi:hypothetical protein
MAPTKKRKYQSTYYTPSEVLEKLNDESDEGRYFWVCGVEEL